MNSRDSDYIWGFHKDPDTAGNRTNVDVYTREDDPIFTGILNANGDRIYRSAPERRIGFRSSRDNSI